MDDDDDDDDESSVGKRMAILREGVLFCIYCVEHVGGRSATEMRASLRHHSLKGILFIFAFSAIGVNGLPYFLPESALRGRGTPTGCTYCRHRCTGARKPEA